MNYCKRPFIVAFHSYKGGCGRTSVLVNVAVMLAQMGKKVLVVDLDWEAPNLPIFFSGITLPRTGLITCFWRILNILKVQDDSDSIATKFNNMIQDDIVVWDSFGKRKVFILPAYGTGDRLDIMRRLSSLEWQNYSGEPSESPRLLWIGFKKYLFRHQLDFDYVLLDSEPGYGMLSKIALLRLADRGISLFKLTPSGIEESANAILAFRCEFRDREKDIKKDREQRSNDDYWQIFPMATLVPVGESGLLSEIEKRLQYAESEFAGDAIRDIIPFVPRLLLRDQIILLDPEEKEYKPLLDSYRAIVNLIIAENPSEDEFFRREADAQRNFFNQNFVEMLWYILRVFNSPSTSDKCCVQKVCSIAGDILNERGQKLESQILGELRLESLETIIKVVKKLYQALMVKKLSLQEVMTIAATNEEYNKKNPELCKVLKNAARNNQ